MKKFATVHIIAYIAFATVGMMALAAGFTIYNINNQRELALVQISQIDKKKEYIAAMQLSARERIITANLIVFSLDSFDRDELKLKFYSAAHNYMVARSKLVALADTEIEKELKKLDEYTTESSTRQATFVDKLIDETISKEDAAKIVSTELLPLQAKVFAKLDELSDHLSKKAGIKAGEAIVGFNQLVVNTILYSSLVISIIVGMAIFAVRRTRKYEFRLDEEKRETVQRTAELTEEVAERKKAEAELLRFKNVLDNTLDMIFMFEPEFLRFVYVNQGAILGMGYSREELLGMTPYKIKPLIPEPEFRQLIAPLLSGEQPSIRFDTVLRRKNGSDFPVAVFLQLVTQSDGSGLFVAIMHDVTEKNKSEELIWQQANFDTLTDLPNRRMFHDRLEQEIKKSHRSGLPMALMLLDLDRFKEVNDTLGHAQGDVLLIEAARRIAECVRESDTVARLGGDEFTVILSELEDVNSVERIAQKIIERLADPFQLLQETAYVSASVGITLYPSDAQNIDALIKNADQAMYLAKNSGRNRFSYFTAALQEAAQTRLSLLSDLRNALPGSQLEVYYQPIVEMTTGKIHKAEALLRWQHPVRGMVSPMQFIPLAEESGLIHEIGDWVFHEAARQVKRCREMFVPQFQISVNKSPVQFRQKERDYDSWPNHLHAMGLPGNSLVVEITEGLLLHAEVAVTETLLSFRDAGIQVALDDFGTGYSSLSYLKKFDIDYIKIDQSFVRNLGEDMNDQALCEAIIVMAHKLGLAVIAEGVETERQRDLLAAYGCDYMQGWLYSKAVPAAEFEALLQRQGRT